MRAKTSHITTALIALFVIFILAKISFAQSCGDYYFRQTVNKSQCPSNKACGSGCINSTGTDTVSCFGTGNSCIGNIQPGHEYCNFGGCFAGTQSCTVEINALGLVPICAACPYGSWQNVSCGGGSCSSTQMLQSQSSSVAQSVCQTKYRCINSASCAAPTDPKPTATPVPINNPIGSHDGSDCSTSVGWACDADDYNSALSIHLYEGATFLGATTANIAREPGVAAACGGNANHGFSFTTPESLKNGVAHSITAYAINIGSGTGNPTLNGTPRLITCAAPTPTPTNVPPPTAYFKVKDTSFYKLGNLSSTVPSSATAYDISDVAPYTVFNQGDSGIVAVQGSISVSPGTISTSGWNRANQTIPSTFHAAAFKSYLLTKKTVTTITDLTQITAPGIYYYNGNLTLTSDIAVDKVVLVVNGNVTIAGTGGATKTFNTATPRSFALVVSGSPAKTLTFADSLTEVRGLFVADDIWFSTNEFFPSSTALKIVGNVSSTAQVSAIRARNTNQTAPSLFIVFDPTQYVNLFDKLSIVKSSWTQIQ